MKKPGVPLPPSETLIGASGPETSDDQFRSPTSSPAPKTATPGLSGKQPLAKRQDVSAAPTSATSAFDEAQYRLILESVSAGIVHVARDGTILHANQLAQEILGLTHDQLTRLYVSSFENKTIHADGTECRVEDYPVSKCLKTGRPQEGKILGVLRPDGTIRWAIFSAQPVCDPASGSLQGAVVTFLDITERKEVENALLNITRGVSARIGKDFFRSLVQHLGQALRADMALIGELEPGVSDRIRSIAVWENGRIVDNFEYKLEGSPCQNMFNKGACVIPDGVAQRFPNERVLQAKGIEAYVGNPLNDSAGELLGLIVVMFKRKLARPEKVHELLQIFVARAAAELERQRYEQVLTENQAQWRTLVEHAPESLVLIDSATGHFLEMNDRALNLFGVKRASLAGLSFPDLSPPYQPDGQITLHQARARIQQAVEGKMPVFEWTIQTWAGEPIPCEVRFVSFSSGGKILVRGSLTDIRKRKRAEQERDRLLLQAKTARSRLEILSRKLVEVQEAEKRRIARELHDEVGQELTALRLNLERIAPRPEAENDPFLRDARLQVNRLLSLVREMSLDLRPTMLDDLGLLPTLIWHLDRLESSRQLQVEFRHNGLDGRRFSAEIETAAYRIVQEALTNVARHAGTTKATVWAWASEDLLSLRIEDSGAGFDVEQALNPGRSNGLSGMRERVSLLGGRFTVHSNQASGTRLTAEFPLTMINPINNDEYP